jgi:hypothetical protein
LISGFDTANPATTTLPSGGVDPDAAFAFTTSTGFEDLVVGNAGDSALALFEGGPNGLTLMSTEFEPSVPSPTDLAFAALTGGQVQFYAATAGRESAELVSLSLSIEASTSSSLSAAAAQNTVAQLVALHETSLPLVTTVLTLTISVSGAELNIGLVETEETAVAAFLPGTSISVGQSLSSSSRGGPGAESDVPGSSPADALTADIAPWQRLVLGLDEAIEQFQREHPNGLSGPSDRDSPSDQGSHPAPRDVPPASDRTDAPPNAAVPSQGGPASLNSGAIQGPTGAEREATDTARPPASAVEAVDATIESVWADDAPDSTSNELSAAPRSLEMRTGTSESCQLSVVSCQSSVVSCHLRVTERHDRGDPNNGQRTTDNEPRMADNGLLGPSVLAATISVQCVHPSRWHRTGRRRSQSRF